MPYKYILYDCSKYVLFKVNEKIQAINPCEFITSYPVYDKNITVHYNNPFDGFVDVEYLYKQDKLQRKTNISLTPLETINFNLKILDKILSDTIKNEDGEETNTNKFQSIKSFAMYIKAMNDLNLEYIEKELNKTD